MVETGKTGKQDHSCVKINEKRKKMKMQRVLQPAAHILAGF